MAMISFTEAYLQVLEHNVDYGTETMPLNASRGRILAAAVTADRDLPPFHRATKDGIALNYRAVESGREAFEIKGIIPAGDAVSVLDDQDSCMEIMTGAVVPLDADTVVMYEKIDSDDGIARLLDRPRKGQNIHRRGSDAKKGDVLLASGTRITAAEVGILASVGCTEPLVRKLPRVAVISTGNEIIPIDQDPLPHQIRRSNVHSLNANLQALGISPLVLHLSDDPDTIRPKLEMAIQEMDVILLSGGVSKGKYDYIPQVLEELGVEKVFHGVRQKPGKPFWFGHYQSSNTLVFSFPGNPVSTFANYHIYFLNWLRKSLGLSADPMQVQLAEQVVVGGDLTRFALAKIDLTSACLRAKLVRGNGSGDLASLSEADGFVQLEPAEETYSPGMLVPFYPSRRIL